MLSVLVDRVLGIEETSISDICIWKGYLIINTHCPSLMDVKDSNIDNIMDVVIQNG